MSTRARSELCDSPREELASSITHGIGAALSVAALVGMLLVAKGEPYKLVSASVFGGTLILLYLSSTLYHCFSGPRLKALFQLFDHACIYLLIAGSYTPLTLVSLRGPWGWSLLGVVWFLALAGVIIKSVFAGQKDHWISTALYIAMGWLAVIAIGPMMKALPPGGLAWLVAGGLSYTLGTIFFAWRRLPFNHAIWHLFVLAGSACHVAAVVLYILR
ncbi:hemolysin III family protein [Luteolibacter ambystomatis]|uniref:Hemolysin III family protein n=1 Tax=Luteolibacter ambystomatis TaxID=2824561 RepID=A0A975J0F4_9BACT|nr:hemolysin III family protein [Luteolibacter ambystomatis]QUE51727.1 hemolysin III family protein [Luteolibacter ambystomatis]